MGILNDDKRCCIKALLRDFEMGDGGRRASESWDAFYFVV